MIDLGSVCYSASVTLNDHPLGTVLAPPYRLSIPKGLLREENTLEITVTNTPANQFVHTGFFDRWTIPQISPYFERTRTMARDSVAGGLYGPVRITLEQLHE